MNALLRAKRNDTGEWIFWNAFGELCHESGKRTRVTINKGATTLYYDYIHQIQHLICEDTITQSLPIKDAKGNLLWESDIIKDSVNNMNFVIKWDEKDLRFVTEMDNCGLQRIIRPFICHCEKIGIFFDNPELSNNSFREGQK